MARQVLAMLNEIRQNGEPPVTDVVLIVEEDVNAADVPRSDNVIMDYSVSDEE